MIVYDGVCTLPFLAPLMHDPVGSGRGADLRLCSQ